MRRGFVPFGQLLIVPVLTETSTTIPNFESPSKNATVSPMTSNLLSVEISSSPSTKINCFDV